jgi:hypothetical protein
VTLNRRSTLTLTLIFSLLGLLPQALSRTLPDIAFPLWAAERMQHGARLLGPAWLHLLDWHAIR